MALPAEWAGFPRKDSLGHKLLLSLEGKPRSDPDFLLQLLVFPQKPVFLSWIEITVMYSSTCLVCDGTSPKPTDTRGMFCRESGGFLDQIATFAATFVLFSCQDLLTSHQTPEKISMKCQSGFSSGDS